MKPTKTTTTETIARVRELDAKATPGPWAFSDKGASQGIISPAVCDFGSVRGFESCEGSPPDTADLDLILEYRTLCPQLADRCEALEKALSVAKEALNGVLNSAFDPVIAKYSSMTPLPPVRLALSEINKLTNQ